MASARCCVSRWGSLFQGWGFWNFLCGTNSGFQYIQDGADLLGREGHRTRWIWVLARALCKPNLTPPFCFECS